MHRSTRALKRAFTLVERMSVVAIIGVLAALAIYGVRKYLASARTSEAKNNVGGITRGAAAGFEGAYAASQVVVEGATSAATANQLCASAAPVPIYVPTGTKYQPSSASGTDFESGDALTGGKRIRFGEIQAMDYQLDHERGVALTRAPSVTRARPIRPEIGAVTWA